ncbi:MAG: hypothetical protein ACKPCP_36675, partial [Sphaerospermopsis kisseleviana]
MAIVAEGKKERVYISPDDQHINIAFSAQPEWKPEANLPDNTRDIRPQIYGMPTYGDLFTNRQLVALTTFSDLVSEAREKVKFDAINAGIVDDNLPLSEGGKGATAYADAVATYLGFGISKLTDYNCQNATWSNSRDQAAHAFTKQAIQMVWNYAEINPFAQAAGDLNVTIKGITEAFEKDLTASKSGNSQQSDASNKLIQNISFPLISTDPPYFDNISYADLSDFFYVWLRRSIGKVYPDICNTLLVPKERELVATPYRFGGDKNKAKEFFETGLGEAFHRMKE